MLDKQATPSVRKRNHFALSEDKMSSREARAGGVREHSGSSCLISSAVASSNLARSTSEEMCRNIIVLTHRPGGSWSTRRQFRPTQFIVDQRDERIERFLISSPQGPENFRNVLGQGPIHKSALPIETYDMPGTPGSHVAENTVLPYMKRSYLLSSRNMLLLR